MQHDRPHSHAPGTTARWPLATLVVVCGLVSVSPAQSTPPLTPAELAMLRAACPSGFEALPSELKAPSAKRSELKLLRLDQSLGERLVAARKAQQRDAERDPGADLRSTIRLASSTQNAAGQWLTPPDNWFVPEDREVPRESPQPAPEEPAAVPETAEPESAELQPTEPSRHEVEKPVKQEAAPIQEATPAEPIETRPVAEPAAPSPRRMTFPPPAAPEPARSSPFEGPKLGPVKEPTPQPNAKSVKTQNQPATTTPDRSAPIPSTPAPRSVAEPPEQLPFPPRSYAPPQSAPDTTPVEQKAAPTPVPKHERAIEKAFDESTRDPVFSDDEPAPPQNTPPEQTDSIWAAPKLPGRQELPAPQESITGPSPVRAPNHGTPNRNAPSHVSPGRNASPHGPPGAAAAEARAKADGKTAFESHAELYAKNCYPSALQCAECHQSIYDDWSVSSHAYAFVSPMFHKFEQRLTELSQGTVGYFCYRCHTPVGTTMATELGYTRATSVGHLPEVAREGVTCIACHRVNERYGKSNGERRIVPGDITAPVYGGVGGDGVADAIARREELKIKLSPEDKKPGQVIHNEGRFFDQLTQAEACTSCHQVAVHPGIKLEVVWEQYRASPACKKGVSCQDCHMGRVPGLPEGYNYGPIAEMSGKTVSTLRKQSSHLFHGPGYSIAHPGVFPQHKHAGKWTVDEWVAFDWRAGWGTDEFEDAIADAEDRGGPTPHFPGVWAEADDRYDAREIIDDNLKRLERKHRSRELVMENASHVDGPFFREPPRAGMPLKFEYVVTNKNEGHNLPTASLGAQPQLWANVVLIGPDGRRLWETGYTDSNGDLCDIHSVDVRHGRAPFDAQLFNLQTMFLVTGATGTDREFPLPVNFSIDQVPHLRPGTIPITVTNHPPFIRMESRSIAPLGKKRVKYKVPAELMCQPGRYRLSFRMRSRTEPMYFMRFCNATPEMLRRMTEGTLDVHPFSVEFEVR